MVDYGVDETFDLYFTEADKFAVVRGFPEFEDDLVVALDDKLSNVIGQNSDLDSVKQKITLLATRLARQFDIIDEVERIRVIEPTNKPETLAVEILYSSGASFEEFL